MAFTATDWGRKAKITIDKDKVDATQTNYEFHFTTAHFPQEAFDADGTYPAKAGGGDIRFSTDSQGANELARVVDNFIIDNDPANGWCHGIVNVPTVSSSVDTDIWVFWNNPAASEPAADSTYGSENSLRANVVLRHSQKESGNGTLDEFKDTSSNDNHGQGGGGVGAQTPTQTTGKLGYGQDYLADWIEIAHAASLNLDSDNFTLKFWMYNRNFDTTGQYKDTVYFEKGDGSNGYFFQRHPLGGGSTFDSLAFKSNGSTITETDEGLLSLNTWHMIHIVRSGLGAQNVKIYIDGVEATYQSQGTHGAINTDTGALNISKYNTVGVNFFLNGLMDEFEFEKGSGSDYSANDVSTDWNNQSDPGTFATVGAAMPTASPPNRAIFTD
jgi:hypothetical protein